MSSKSNLKEILSKLDTLPKSFLINLGIPQKSLDKKEQLSTISNYLKSNRCTQKEGREGSKEPPFSGLKHSLKMV